MTVAVVGGGAAGMLAAIRLRKQGYEVDVYEQNEKLGKKLFITGKGRCNLTNHCDAEELLKHVVTNSKFLYSAFSNFDAEDTMRFFEDLGLRLKTERGNRVFPQSDHSSDVIRVLETCMQQSGVRILLSHKVLDILIQNDDETQGKRISGLVYRDAKGLRKEKEYDKVVLATGGLSYPRTGSTGDGIKFAKQLGLQTVPCVPSLVPFEIEESFCKDLMGLSLRNVELSCYTRKKNKDKCLYKEQGEMLFTHFGISGPLVLSASAYAGKYQEEPLWVTIDMKPALTVEQLDARILRDFEQNQNKQIRNALDALLPKKMIPIVIAQADVDPYLQVNAVSRQQRQKLVQTLKHFTLHVTGLRGYDEAIITKGGISVKEINPKTMEAKKIPGLYVIGELLDVDALTGGFNLQIAWSTAAMTAPQGQ